MAAAAATAAATLGAGYLTYRRDNNALKSQERANIRAMRQQGAQERQAVDDYNRRWTAWNQSRNGILRHFGINIPGSGPATSSAAGPGGVPAGTATGVTLGRLAGLSQGGGGGAVPLAEGPEEEAAEVVQDWNDWRRYV